MERVETRVRIRGGKWTTRLAFFSFHPSRLFVSGKLKPVDTRQIGFEASPFPRTRPSRCEQPPSLNSIKRFHLHFASRTVFRTVANGSKKKIEPRPNQGKSFVLLRRRALCCQAYYICSTAFEMYQLFVLQRWRERKKEEFVVFIFFFWKNMDKNINEYVEVFINKVIQWIISFYLLNYAVYL